MPGLGAGCLQHPSVAEKAPKKVKTEQPLDISHTEGVDLLSATERQLCSELRLLPAHYMAIKDKLIRESFARGFLQREQARQLIRIGTLAVCLSGAHTLTSSCT